MAGIEEWHFHLIRNEKRYFFILDLTLVSNIPDDASIADTYYSQNDDFEDDLSSISSESEEEEDWCDYSALVGCMENALDLRDDDVTSTFGDSYQSSIGSKSLRKQRIEALRR